MMNNDVLKHRVTKEIYLKIFKELFDLGFNCSIKSKELLVFSIKRLDNLEEMRVKIVLMSRRPHEYIIGEDVDRSSKERLIKEAIIFLED